MITNARCSNVLSLGVPHRFWPIIYSLIFLFGLVIDFELMWAVVAFGFLATFLTIIPSEELLFDGLAAGLWWKTFCAGFFGTFRWSDLLMSGLAFFLVFASASSAICASMRAVVAVIASTSSVCSWIARICLKVDKLWSNS